MKVGISAIVLLIVFQCMALFLFPVAALATDSDIVINEIMYNPATSQGSDTNYEYIELVNIGTQSVDVNGWQISDNAETDTIGPYHPGSPTTIHPGGYAFIRDNDSYLVVKSGIHLAVDDSNIGNNLNNTGDDLTLSNGAVIIDTVSYESGDGADGNGSSLECRNPTLDNSTTGNGNWGESTPSSEYGTPGLQNSIYIGPLPPVPEYPVILLCSLGLVGLAGIIFFARNRRSLPRELKIGNML